MMKQKLYLVALLCVTLFGFASCLSDSDDDNKLLLTDYFTITGTYPNYKLIGDGGEIVYPTTASVNDCTDSKGFGDYKRAQLYAYYSPKDTTIENGTTIIRYAELEDGIYFEEKKAITFAEATEAGILEEDSIFNIKGHNSWLAKGYLSSIFTADYSIVNNKEIKPGVNLCATSTEENAITLKFLYNRHTQKTNVSSYEGLFYYSFDVTNLNIPGNDSITITFDVTGSTLSKLKVARSDFYFKAQ